MKKVLKNILSVFINPRKPARGRKTAGQSLVEIAIALPILLMLFSGMVEFGFMLNTYLSLLDATRQVARAYSNENPFMVDPDDPDVVIDNMSFYGAAASRVVDILDPWDDPGARSIVFDPSQDDIVISVIAVSVRDSVPNAIESITRYPDPGANGLSNPYYQLFGNHLSLYASDSQIETMMTENGTPPVRTGILIIEIFYSYEGVLQLPWVEMFLDSVMLHADTVMPLVSAKPPRID